MKRVMEKYKGSEEGGVLGYEIVENGIILEFKDGSTYFYDEVRPGKTHVERMKELAIVGKELTTYVNQNIRDNYREKLYNGLESNEENNVQESEFEYPNVLKDELDKRYSEYKDGTAETISAFESKKRIRKILNAGKRK